MPTAHEVIVEPRSRHKKEQKQQEDQTGKERSTICADSYQRGQPNETHTPQPRHPQPLMMLLSISLQTLNHQVSSVFVSILCVHSEAELQR
jgi:hypothetical protein